jgi:hypothetical protein
MPLVVAPRIRRLGQRAAERVDAVLELDGLDAVRGRVEQVDVVEAAVLGGREGHRVGGEAGDERLDLPVRRGGQVERVWREGRGERRARALRLGDVGLEVDETAAGEDVGQREEGLGRVFGEDGEAGEGVDVWG